MLKYVLSSLYPMKTAVLLGFFYQKRENPSMRKNTQEGFCEPLVGFEPTTPR